MGRKNRHQQQIEADRRWRHHRLHVTADPHAPMATSAYESGTGLHTATYAIETPAGATVIRPLLGLDGKPQYSEALMGRVSGQLRRPRLWLTVNEVADVLDISYDAAHSLVDSGRLESHRPTREYRIPISALVAYMRACGMQGETLGAARAHIEAIIAADTPATPATPRQTASPEAP